MDRAATTGTFGTGADTRPPDVGKRIHSRRMLVDASTLPEPHRSGGPRDYSWLSPSAISDSLRTVPIIDRPPWPREEKHEEPPGIEPVRGMRSAIDCGRGWRAGAVSGRPGDPGLNAGGPA